MKQTELEVGKEYWLDAIETIKVKLMSHTREALFCEPVKDEYKFKQVNCLSCREFVSDKIPAALHEVVKEKSWQFTTPIAMKCTEDQFNGIKDGLVEMGYEISTFSRNSGQLMCTNFGSDHHYIGMSDLPSFQELVLESFNPDLFLALAAMTDKEDGIKGEWWRYTDDMNDPIVPQKRLGEFVVPNKAWRKATAQEIMAHFEKKTLSSQVTPATEDTLTKLLNQVESNLKHLLEGRDKEFLLQPSWYVQLTHENYDIVKKWHEKIDSHKGNRCYTIGAYYGIHENGSGDCWTQKEDAERYQIITTEQFKKYVLKETQQSCLNYYFSTNTVTYSHDSNIGFLFARRTLPNYLSGTIRMSSTPTETKTIILIPPTKQATLFDDRVEITDWRPKEGEAAWQVFVVNGISYKDMIYTELHNGKSFEAGFIKRTESEAKQLVEKLKQAML